MIKPLAALLLCALLVLAYSTVVSTSEHGAQPPQFAPYSPPAVKVATCPVVHVRPSFLAAYFSIFYRVTGPAWYSFPHITVCPHQPLPLQVLVESSQSSLPEPATPAIAKTCLSP